jgi:hypothetical protein
MNLGDDAHRLATQACARLLTDRQLADSGWSVQDSRSLNLFAAQGVVRARQRWRPGTVAPTSCSTSTNGSSG